jgi:hypothetical protein
MRSRRVRAPESDPTLDNVAAWVSH